MREHVGSHILLETDQDWLVKYKVVKPDFPCGLCGVRGAVGQKLADESVDMCVVMTQKPSKTEKPLHYFKRVGSIDYGLKDAAKVTTNRACTNRPIKCPSMVKNGHLGLDITSAPAPSEACGCSPHMLDQRRARAPDMVAL